MIGQFLTVGAIGALFGWCIGEMLSSRVREEKPMHRVFIEWIPGQGYMEFVWPLAASERKQVIRLFRNRKREMPTEFDHQCAYCHLIYSGPDEGFNPGIDIQVGPSGAPVSHGACDPACPENTFEQEMRQRYPQLKRFRDEHE